MDLSKKQKVFFKTFPRHILTQIQQMVETGVITQSIGKRLLGVYINTHHDVINCIALDIEYDYNEIFNAYFEKEFKIKG